MASARRTSAAESEGRAHAVRERIGGANAGGAVSGGIGCLDQSRSRNRTQGNRLQANGGGSVARGRQPGGARERVAHRFERASIRVSWRVLTEIRFCVREFEPPCARGFRFPQVNRLHMSSLGKKGSQAPSPTADFRKNPPEIASARALGSRDHATKERDDATCSEMVKRRVSPCHTPVTPCPTLPLPSRLHYARASIEARRSHCAEVRRSPSAT